MLTITLEEEERVYDLRGKVALVTGSSMGLGKAFALHLAKAGAKVVVNDPFGGEEAMEAVRDIKRGGGEAIFVLCNVNDPHAVSNMADTVVNRFQRIDILINNAGISIDGMTASFNPDEWDRVLKINLSGAFYCTRFCLPSMIQQKWGRIINITSVVAQTGAMGTPAYTASKAGMIGFTKTVAKEVARKGITVNAIALGYFESGGLFQTVPPKIAEGILATIPAGRWGKVEDITGVINFLVSDSAAYITGQTLNLNGGLYM